MSTNNSETVVYYVRHGENRANLTQTFSHRVVDYPLTPTGVEQAHAIAERLVAEGNIATPIFTSPMRRASETAQIIADALKAPWQEIENFREVNVGSLDGKSDPASWEIYEGVMADWFDGKDPLHAFPEGENRLDALARFKKGLRQIIDSEPTGPAIVVSHGGLLVGTLSALCPGVTMPKENLLNCGIAKLTLQLKDDEIVGCLDEWNDETWATVSV